MTASAPKKSFQIKVLPKTGEGPAIAGNSPKKKSIHVKTSKSKSKSGRKKTSSLQGPLILLGVIAAALGGLYWVNVKAPKPSSASAVKAANPENKKLKNYLEAAQQKEAFQKMRVQVENQAAVPDDLPAFLPLEDQDPGERRPMGVELDSDPSMNRVYDDLYGSSEGGRFQTPEERIGARLAQKKWLYEYQLSERKVFIQNFIEAAKLAGYEVKIDENLVVTEVKPLRARPSIPLDQVLENLATARSK